MPVFAAKGGGFFAIVVGVIAIMGGVFQINPIWNFGPYNPSQISAGSQPDWYMGWTDGLVRIWPAWEFYLGNYTIPGVFLPFILGLPLLTGSRRLPVDRTEDDQGLRAPQPAAAPA